jgi:hypothetical protein
MQVSGLKSLTFLVAKWRFVSVKVSGNQGVIIENPGV